MNQILQMFYVVFTVILSIGWVGGIVISHGFLSCVIAVCFAPYAWWLLLSHYFNV